MTTTLATALAGGGASAASATSCPSVGHTIDRSGQVRLYYLGSNIDHSVYTCVLASGRTRRLGYYEFNTAGIGRPTLAGRYVAWDDFDCNPRDGCAGSLQVKDIVANRRVLESGPLQHGAAIQIVLTTRGRVAYTRSSYPERFVWAFKPNGSEQLLDSGPQIDLTSVALAGRRVYWTNSGQPRSALPTP